MDHKEKLISNYFDLGFHHSEVLLFLKKFHNITISCRTLKRILAKLQLYRRKKYSPLEDVVKYISEEVNKSGQLHGYRWMHLKCLQNGLTVTQEVVRELLNILDPKGIELRKKNKLRRRQYQNKGPNYLWHMDSYDKLKPYGICINGCIDGFSRYIIWLKAGRTSSNSRVIAGYYVNALKCLHGYPRTIRSDMGTENVVVERIQKALFELFPGNGSKPSFITGKSPANQRIESWWSILRKQNAQYWMNVFEILKENGLYCGTFLDKSLIQFCFLDIIQNELDNVVLQWNTHRIRKTRNSVSPSGRPAVMYEMPDLYNAENYLIKVSTSMLDILEEECTSFEHCCDEDVFNLCKFIMLEKNYSQTNDPYDAVQLYSNLRREILNILNSN